MRRINLIRNQLVNITYKFKIKRYDEEDYCVNNWKCDVAK